MDCASLLRWLEVAGNVGLPLLAMSYVLVRVEKAVRALAAVLALERRPPGAGAP